LIEIQSGRIRISEDFQHFLEEQNSKAGIKVISESELTVGFNAKINLIALILIYISSCISGSFTPTQDQTF